MARKPKRQNYTFVVVTYTFNYTICKSMTGKEATEMFDHLCAVSDTIVVTCHCENEFVSGWSKWK